MVQMPTGTGKTVLMSEVMRSERLKVKGEKCSVLVVAHRRELIEQIQNQIKRTEELDFEIIRTEEQKDLDRRTEGQNLEIIRTEEHKGKDIVIEERDDIVVTSIQKLARAKEGDPLFAMNFSLIIVDEAHHAAVGDVAGGEVPGTDGDSLQTERGGLWRALRRAAAVGGYPVVY